MNKIVVCISAALLLSSCSGTEIYPQELTSEQVMSTYTQDNRGINLSDTWLYWFVSLNGLNGETEIVNIDVSQNEIEVLNISQYDDLGRLIISGNNVRFFWDIYYPENIRHIDLSYNELTNLDGIEKLSELKTLNVSHNNLDEDDFRKLADLENLQLVLAQGNNISSEFLQNLNTFNAPYLRSIKK